VSAVDPAQRRLHRGRLVLGVLMVVLAVVAVADQAGLVGPDPRYLVPLLLVVAGVALLVTALVRDGRADP
jgi:peptidoglycan/LPS O-acetylase OafA/YrhL